MEEKGVGIKELKKTQLFGLIQNINFSFISTLKNIWHLDIKLS